MGLGKLEVVAWRIFFSYWKEPWFTFGLANHTANGHYSRLNKRPRRYLRSVLELKGSTQKVIGHCGLGQSQRMFLGVWLFILEKKRRLRGWMSKGLQGMNQWMESSCSYSVLDRVREIWNTLKHGLRLNIKKYFWLWVLLDLGTSYQDCLISGQCLFRPQIFTWGRLAPCRNGYTLKLFPNWESIITHRIL